VFDARTSEWLTAAFQLGLLLLGERAGLVLGFAAALLRHILRMRTSW
jgi:hypothetical protein